MIRHCFKILPGVKEKKAQTFLHQGIHTWDHFLASSKVKGVSPLRKRQYDQLLNEAQMALRQENWRYFHEKLPSQEMWRIFDHCKGEVMYLDIETSGYYGDVTVIGLFDGFETKTFVKGVNLQKNTFFHVISQAQLLVTFNGSSFDLPVLERYFGKKIENPHLDLRYTAKLAGYSGGLKAIEKELGIERPKEVTTISGSDAVYLWQMWQSTGNRDYLELLVKYNEEDIINLKPLAEKVIRMLKDGLPKT